MLGLLLKLLCSSFNKQFLLNYMQRRSKAATGKEAEPTVLHSSHRSEGTATAAIVTKGPQHMLRRNPLTQLVGPNQKTGADTYHVHGCVPILIFLQTILTLMIFSLPSFGWDQPIELVGCASTCAVVLW